MTELRRNPCGRGVAGFAGVIADDVIGRFTSSLDAVVTIEAITRDRTMIETRCDPRRGGMA